MRYMCTNCSYVFDESLWDQEEGIWQWTLIETLDICPVCQEYESFQWIKEEINLIEWNDMYGLEKEHFPQIIPKVNRHGEEEIEVIVWDPSHPMWEDHFISSVMLYDEYDELVKEEFLLPESETKIIFNVSDLDDYMIVVRCSIHGLWWVKINH